MSFNRTDLLVICGCFLIGGLCSAASNALDSNSRVETTVNSTSYHTSKPSGKKDSSAANITNDNSQSYTDYSGIQTQKSSLGAASSGENNPNAASERYKGILDSSTNKRNSDPYDVYDYSDPDDFADDRLEDFMDDYDEDEDDAYTEAYDYWEEAHDD